MAVMTAGQSPDVAMESKPADNGAARSAVNGHLTEPQISDGLEPRPTANGRDTADTDVADSMKAEDDDRRQPGCKQDAPPHDASPTGSRPSSAAATTTPTPVAPDKADAADHTAEPASGQDPDIHMKDMATPPDTTSGGPASPEPETASDMPEPELSDVDMPDAAEPAAESMKTVVLSSEPPTVVTDQPDLAASPSPLTTTTAKTTKTTGTIPDPEPESPSADHSVKPEPDDEAANQNGVDAETASASGSGPGVDDSNPAAATPPLTNHDDPDPLSQAPPSEVSLPVLDALATKQGREREADVNDEPAAKRVRTEAGQDDQDPKSGHASPATKPELEPEPEPAPEPAPESEAGPDDAGLGRRDMPSTGEPALDAIPRWLDSAIDSIPIGGEAQVRQHRHNISLAKKTTAGISFKDSVAKLWPALWDAYTTVVRNPMDLTEMDRKIRHNVYTNLGEFRHDLGLLYTNAISFNGRDHMLVSGALKVVETLWGRTLEVAAEKAPALRSAKSTLTSRHAESRPRIANLNTNRAATATAMAATAHNGGGGSGKNGTKNGGGGNSTSANPAPSTPALSHAYAQSSPAASAAPVQASRRQSSIGAAAAASPADRAPATPGPGHVSPAEQPYAVLPGGVPQIRRASTMSDGNRPKRAIHAPKPKDLDYSSKSSKKHLRPELQFCDEVLISLMSQKNFPINYPFMEPVDPVSLKIPDYFKIIKKPMDLGTISTRLGAGEYQTAKQFDADVKLVFSNCFKFNPADSQVHRMGKTLEALYRAEFGNKASWLARNASKATSSSPAVAAPPASHGFGSDHNSGLDSDREDGDEEDEEDEDDEEDGGGHGGRGGGMHDSGHMASFTASTSNETIDMLQDKLKEETSKLLVLFAETKPNPSLINLQQNVVKAVQDSLLKEKAKVTAGPASGGGSAETGKPEGGGGGRPPKGRPGRPGRPPKPKPGRNASIGGGAAAGPTAGHKRAGGGLGASAPRRATSNKKRRKLTQQEKEAVAAAIPTMPSPHIDTAIVIIKRDTGQLENPDGEIELDIEQLSDDALARLWDLCKKVLPTFGSDLTGLSVTSPLAPPPPKRAAKAAPRKNKPMSAREQENAIQQLLAVEARFEGAAANAAPVAATPPAVPTPITATHATMPNMSTDGSDSDSEEE